MAEQKQNPIPIYVDGFSSFELGINSGVAPLLLAKNQLSFAINATVRGNFVSHRPCFRKIALTFDTPQSQAIFEAQGLWQGGCFFKSEYGTEAMVVSIGGRLFQVRPDTIGGAFVSDISIPGDLNNTGTPIAWLWQAERWVIVQNGSQLPLFYDGQITRRSFGPSTVIGTTAIDWAVPAIGGNVNVTLTAPYTGPYNTTVFVDNAFYQVNAGAGGGYQITLQSLSESPGQTVAGGNQVQIPGSSFMGPLSQDCPVINTVQCLVHFNPPIAIPNIVGGFIPVIFVHLRDQGFTYTVPCFAIVANQPTYSQFFINTTTAPFLPPTLFQGAAVWRGAPSVAAVIGQLTGSFITPALNGSVVATIDVPYNGAVPQIVIINGGTYRITATNNNPVVSNIVNITNLNDTLAGNRGPTTPTTPGIFSTVPEILTGEMGAYGLGRNWYALADGRSYRATDIVGGSSGSPSVQNRDAVLRETENTFLTNGNFVIPGNIGDIRSMTFTATLDSSLGQGPLQVGTPTTVFSNNAPVDSSLWQTMENPIQTQSLKGIGPLNQYGTILVNSDTLFRSTFGLGSLILARREFATWGNTPISREVQRVIDQDNPALLEFGSAVQFSNRFLTTSKPIQSLAGVFHQGAIALNFEPISGIGQKAQSVYDGLWTGVNTMLWIVGGFQSVPRAFNFSFNSFANKIEVYELLDDSSPVIADNNGIEDIPITWTIETAMLFKDLKNKAEFDLCKLIDGELDVAEVAGRVRFEVFYRSQFDPCWHLWNDFTICATQGLPLARQQNRVQLGLGKPPADSCDPSNSRPYYIGETFQFRIRITGHCKIYGIIIKACAEPKRFFLPAMCGEQECKLVQCVVDSDYGTYLLQDRPVPPTPVVFNQNTTVVHQCPFGTQLTFTGSLPTWLILDGATNSLTAKSGTFTGATQEEADVAAQNAINDFITAAVAAGTLTCVNPIPPLSIVLVNAETTGWGAEGALGFVEVAGVFYGLGQTNMNSSTDGVNWTVGAAHAISTAGGITFGVGLYVVASSGFPTNRVYSSPDRVAWTPHVAGGVTNAEAITFGGGIFVLVGDLGQAATSPDGLNWTGQAIGGMHSHSVAFGVGIFVAVGQEAGSGRIYSSPTGAVWTLRVTSGATSNLRSVSFSNGLFIAVGNSGRIYTSPDGTTWTLQAQVVDGTLVASGGGAGTYVICTFGGDVYTSPDGIVWTFLKTEPSTRIAAQQGVAYYSVANVIDVGYFP